MTAVKPGKNSRKHNSGLIVKLPEVDCSDIPVATFNAIDCRKREYAHLRNTGPGYISLATSTSLMGDRDEQ